MPRPAMRFVVTGEWTRNRLLLLIVWLFLLFVALFWLTNLLLYTSSFGFDAESVVRFYRGDEAAFREPRSYRGMLELSHFHLFSMGVLVLTLAHLLLFVPCKQPTKLALILASFLSALGDELAGWLVRYLHPAFAYVKIASFVLLQASLLAMILLIGHAMATRAPSRYTESEGRSRAPSRARGSPQGGRLRRRRRLGRA